MNIFMKAWFHNKSAGRDFVSDLRAQFLNNQEHICRYCSNTMIAKEIPDLWNHRPEDYIQAHCSILDFDRMMKEKGVPLEDLELEDGDPREDIYCRSLACKVCGWWLLEKRVICSAKTSQVWELDFATAGALKNLDLTDISIPIEEIRKYISANYQSRFSINPKKFEELVASVFKDIGYDATVTAYSNDGGIDVILSGSKNDQVGVQVKRYKHRIKVEQIRSFIGALVVNGCTSGIFVTTSGFQRGAYELAKKSGKGYAAIELMDAEKFFEALEIVQMKSFSGDYPLDTISSTPEVHVVSSTYLNSL